MKKQTIVYDDKIARYFASASIIWGIVGMLVGVTIALQLAFWQANLPPYLSFGRLRPLHTNAVIFAFVGNMLFAGIYYSTQRLLKVRMASDKLSWAPLLGLAGDHRLRRDHAPPRHHHLQGIRGARVADRHRHRGRLGHLRRQLLLDALQAERKAALRRALVLHRDHHHHRGAAHRELPGDPLLRLRELLDLRRRPGRARPVVVRPQRRRLLPDHPDPRDHVLLPAEGSGATGVQLPAVDRALLGSGLHLHLGRTPPPALHRAPRVGADPRHDLQPHALGAELGRHDQRPADPARRVGQAPQGPGAEVLRRRRDLLRHERPSRARLLSIKAVNGLAHYTDWIIGHVHAGAPRMERLHGCGDVLLDVPAPVRTRSSTAKKSPTTTSGSGPSASFSTSSPCGSQASPRA